MIVIKLWILAQKLHTQLEFKIDWPSTEWSNHIIDATLNEFDGMCVESMTRPNAREQEKRRHGHGQMGSRTARCYSITITEFIASFCVFRFCFFIVYSPRPVSIVLRLRSTASNRLKSIFINWNAPKRIKRKAKMQTQKNRSRPLWFVRCRNCSAAGLRNFKMGKQLNERIVFSHRRFALPRAVVHISRIDETTNKRRQKPHI